jgi:hypothetical protein
METISIDKMIEQASTSEKHKNALGEINMCHEGLAKSIEEENYFTEIVGGVCSRVLVGYYIKGEFKVAFYDNVPSWWSRTKMYWIFGWKWENVKK